MNRNLTTAVLIAGLASSPVFAQQTQDHGPHQPAAGVEATASSLTEGEVRRVDREAKKITLRHGPIANLDMPPMTMVFQVSTPR